MSEREQLEQAITALEAQRGILGDAVVDASVAALREKLTALEAAPSDQQRKQITVLFGDVSGFTAMSEKMDAEDVNEIINALWRQLDGVIIEHGGIIDKHIGDAVMALWGAEIAREDDPQQAIRAALAMLEALAAFRESEQIDLAMRIGINTGPVLLGEVGTTGEYTAMGDTVNVASRLEEAAPVGGVLISHATYQHVRGLFEVQALHPIEVRGKTEPIEVCQVLRAEPRAFRLRTRGVEGIETPMVGREAELTQLRDAFYGMMDGERQMVTIVGDAGVGKSRLLYEFENWLELLPYEICYFKGRASLEMQHVPYALIRDLLSFRFQIKDSDRARVMRQKVEAGVGQMLATDESGPMQAHFIGQLLGFDFSDSPHLQGVLDDAQQLRDRALIYLSEYFRATAARTPTVVFLEDIHWVDDSSLDVIHHLALTTPGRHLLMVCLARPVLFERRSQWAEGLSFHAGLTLSPLSKRDSRRLVEEILHKVEQVPAALRELIVSGAEGNPFYVEELIKMLIEDGVIIKGETRWRVEPTRLTTVRVPSTLTGVLQARLDSLPLAERTMLQRASIVGRRFWDSVLAYLGADGSGDAPPAREAMDPREVSITLSALLGKEMVFRRATSAFAETQEFIFKHAVLRDVTYESVLKKVRRVYHSLVAEWLIEQSGERAGEYTGLIADHLESAGEAERAVAYLRQAGERAAAQFANAEAVTYFSRALDLTSKDDLIARCAFLQARETVYDLQGEREAQTRDLMALEELAEALDDGGQQAARRRAEVALRQANYAQVTSDYPKAGLAAQTAVRLAQAGKDVDGEAAGYLQWGRALWSQGDLDAAQSRLEQALALARHAGLRQLEAECLRTLGDVPHVQGDYAEARAFFERSLPLSRAIGDRRGEGVTLSNLGNIAYHLDDYAAAKTYYEQALLICREIGDRTGESRALGNLGNVALDDGDYDRARTYFEEAQHIFREIGHRRGEGIALLNLGNVYLKQGEYLRAKRYFERALHLSCEIGDRWIEGGTLAKMILLSHHLEDDATAQEYVQQALRVAHEIGDRSTQSDALHYLGHILPGPGQLTEAAEVYERALEIRRELGEHNRAMESLAGLACVSLKQGDLSQALARVEEILSHLESSAPSTALEEHPVLPSAPAADAIPARWTEHGLHGTDEPSWVYLTCYHVLRVAPTEGEAGGQDPRAQMILEMAYHHLQKQAAKIKDEVLRRSFLENVAANQEIVREWQVASRA